MVVSYYRTCLFISTAENNLVKYHLTRLNYELQSQRITKYALAKGCGLSKQTVCNWCDGISEPKATQIAKISRFLNVSSDYLLGLSDI